ncbi:hypothetical protein ACWEN3_16845 [Streptomyces sp. NPDC004561]
MTDLDEYPGRLERELRALSRPPADLARSLCQGGQWLLACAAAAHHDTSWLDTDHRHTSARPVDGTPPSTALHIIEGTSARESDYDDAVGVWHAARAARALLHHDGAGAAAGTCMAALALTPATIRAQSPGPWLDAVPSLTDAEAAEFRAHHPGLAWDLAEDLVRALIAKNGAPGPTISTPVLLGTDPEASFGTVHLTSVGDLAARMLPDPEGALFSAMDRSTPQALETAFAWTRSQEDFPTGRGVRWQVRDTHGMPVPTPRDAELALAAAAALARLFHPRRARLFTPSGMHPNDAAPDRLLHGRLTTLGTLEPVGDAVVEAVRHCATAHRTIVLHPADAQTARSALDVPRRSVRSARTVRAALSASARIPRRLIAVVTVTALAVTGSVVTYVYSADKNAEREAIATKASQLATHAMDIAASDPREAAVAALGAHALAPTSVAARDALLAAADNDLRRTRLIAASVPGAHALALDHDGTRASVIGGDGELHLWNLRTGRAVAAPSSVATDVRDARFPSATGPLAIATGHGVLTWRPDERGAPVRLTTAVATALAYSADGRRLAAGTSDGTVRVYDVRGRTQLKVLRFAHTAVTALSFSRDGSTIAEGGSSSAITLWKWRTAASPTKPVSAANGSVNSLVYADACSCFYVTTRNRLTVVSGSDGHRLRAPISIAQNAVALFSDREGLMLGSGNGITTYAGKPDDLSDSSGKLKSADGVYGPGTLTRDVAALSGDGKVLITAAGQAFAVYSTASDSVDPYAWAPTVRQVFPVPHSSLLLYVTAGWGNNGSYAYLFDTRKKKGDRGVPVGRLSSVQGADFSRRHMTLAAAGADGHVRLFPYADGKLAQSYSLPATADFRAKTVAFDDGRNQLVAGWAHKVTVYDVSEPRKPTARYSIGLPDHELLVSASIESERKTLFLATGAGLYAVPDRSGKYSWNNRTVLASGEFIAVRTTPGGDVLAATVNGALSVYHPTAHGSWRETQLAGHGSQLTVAAPAGPYVVATDFESAKVFDADSGVKITDIRLANVLATGLWYNGTQARIYGDYPGSSVVFPLDDRAVLSRVCTRLGDGADLTVADAWQQAPDSVRHMTLCGAETRDRP